MEYEIFREQVRQALITLELEGQVVSFQQINPKTGELITKYCLPEYAPRPN